MCAQRVASLYAEIGADTRGLRRGLDETKGALNKAQRNLTHFTTGAVAGFAAITGAVIAAKKAIDFAKEGAQLEMVRGKFDNLSDSIGVTSDALLRKLRTATQGTRSDMELVASAADFMSLGLAKTEDQVVRLTRVAGALGMDMNQLVLTLANRTTMRFDQLGVAVDGFSDRLKGLEKQGYSTEDAFTEAFLQQAEAQITRVGDIAETDAGKIMMLESSIKNLGDTAKLAAAPSLGYLAQELTRVIRESQEFNSLINYSPVYMRRFDDEIVGVNSSLDEATRLAANAAASFDNHAKAIKHVGDSSAREKEKMQAFLDTLDTKVDSPIKGFIEDMRWWQAGGWKINQAFADLQQGVVEKKITPSQAEEWAGNLYKATQDLQVDLDMITADEAAANIEATMGGSLQDAKNYITGTDGIEAALEQITQTKWYIDVFYREHGKPAPWPGGQGPDEGGTGEGGKWGGEAEGAHGLDMIIPPGYPSDTFRIGATSGERVTITPQGKGGGDGAMIVQNIYPSPGMDEYSLANYTALVLSQRARRSALAGAGYVGQ